MELGKLKVSAALSVTAPEPRAPAVVPSPICKVPAVMVVVVLVLVVLLIITVPVWLAPPLMVNA